jgi:hypothetical protein
MPKLNLKKILLTIESAIAVFLLFNCVASAQSVTQGYKSDTLLQNGMIVGLDPKDVTKVEPINSAQYNLLHGVVVNPSNSIILIGNNSTNVYVSTSGRVSVMVNDQNGNINPGDYVALSSVSGIGDKAILTDPLVLGKSVSAFNATDSAQQIGTVTVKDSTGKTSSLHIGYVTIDIAIGKNPLIVTDNSLPSILSRASNLVAGKIVSPVRVYVSILVLAITAFVSGSLIYGGVRSSMISIGRNPLSKKVITRSLTQVVIVSLLVFLSGVFGVYLLLKL